MTLHATREGQAITVHGNTGTEVLVKNGQVQHVRITETAQHVRGFWSQLGHLIDDAEGQEHTAAHRAYEAYREHCGGKSVHGEELPSWEDQDDTVRGHWVAAAEAIS